MLIPIKKLPRRVTRYHLQSRINGHWETKIILDDRDQAQTAFDGQKIILSTGQDNIVPTPIRMVKRTDETLDHWEPK